MTAIEASYRQVVAERLGHWSHEGLGAEGGPLHLPLLEAFVEPVVVPVQPEPLHELSIEERRLLEAAEQQGRVEGEHALHLGALHSQRWRQRLATGERLLACSPPLSAWLVGRPDPLLLLLGEPSLGKSTLLRALAVRHAQLPPGSSSTLPLYMPLESLEHGGLERGLELEEWLAAWWEQQGPLSGLGGLFQQALEQGRAWVLLDGLDKVREPAARQRLLQAVRTWGERWAAKGNRLVLASRPALGLELPEAWPRYVLLGLGWPAALQLSRRVHEAWEAGPRAQAEAQALVQELSRWSEAVTLATSPWGLAWLLRLRRRHGRLPEHPVELLQGCIHLALGEHSSPLPALEGLALWLLQHRPSGLVHRHELEQVLASLGHPESLEALGASRLLVEYGPGVWALLYPCLREQLAGSALARLSAEERWRLLAPGLHHPGWRMPLLRCAGLLPRSELDKLVERILSAGSEQEPLLHRDVLLAARVASQERVWPLGKWAWRLLSSLPAPLARVYRQAPLRLAQRLEALLHSDILSVRRRALLWLALLIRAQHAGALKVLSSWLQEDSQVQQLHEGLVDEFTRDGLAGKATPRQRLLSWLEQHAPGIYPLLERHLPLLRPQRQPRLEYDLREATARRALLEALPPLESPDRERLLAGLALWAAVDEPLRQGLLERLGDGDPHVRSAAALALEHVSGEPPVREALQARLADEDLDVVAAAALALQRQAGRHEPVRRELQALLVRWRGRSWEVCSAALRGLVAWGSKDEEVRTLLLDLVERALGEGSPELASALGRLASSSREVRDHLLSCLSNPEAEQQEFAARALAALARGDAEVRSALQVWLESLRSGELNQEWVDLTWLVEIDAGQTHELLQWLGDPSHRMRGRAVALLAEQVESDERVKQALMRRLEDEHDEVRQHAVVALARLVASDGEVRHALLERLRDKDSEVRERAVEALACLLEGDEEVGRALLERLQRDWSSGVQLRVLQAIAGEEVKVSSVTPRFLGVSLARQTVDDELEFFQLTQALHGARDVHEVRRVLLAELTSRPALLLEETLRYFPRMLGSDEGLRRRMLEWVEDKQHERRRVALKVLEARAGEDEEVRRAVQGRLEDVEPQLQEQAARILARWSASNPASQQQQAPSSLATELPQWLGATGFDGQRLRGSLALSLARQVEGDERLLGQLTALLRAPYWETREGAALVLLSLPGGTPARLIPALRALMDDITPPSYGGLTLFHADVARALLDAPEQALRERGLEVLLEMLEPQHTAWDENGRLQERAYLVGLLEQSWEPLERNERLFHQVLRLLQDMEKTGTLQDQKRQAWRLLLSLANAPPP